MVEDTATASLSTPEPVVSLPPITPPITKKTDAVIHPSHHHHPTIEYMVNYAIMATQADNHHGSSLQAIKKYIANAYNFDANTKHGLYIKKYLKQAVSNGDLIQTKGHGAMGSFKLAKRSKITGKILASKTPSHKKPDEKKKTTSKIISKEKTLATKQQQRVCKMLPKPRKTVASKGHALRN
ncbi:histone H1-like [Aphidius gifuensis]|uniref:histone H1-like n=1 Tax=Aphidius gifuensis TaxID=684658 RepID=UPI001CDBC848|nr:histone H1-like [Aphidius gifuensis]